MERRERDPEEALDSALDVIVAGNEARFEDEQIARHIWAAEMLVARGFVELDPDDPVERDRVIRDARRLWGKKKYRRPGRFRALKYTSLVLLGIMIVSTVIVVRAQSALPGERLWKVKRWTEGVQQWAAKGDVAEAEAALANTAERLSEAEILIGSGRRQIARAVVFEFYREFEEVRFRLRDLSPERHRELFDEAERQLAVAVEIDRRVSGDDVQQEAPVTPVVGTRSPTPRPPWLPASP